MSFSAFSPCSVCSDRRSKNSKSLPGGEAMIKAGVYSAAVKARDQISRSSRAP